MTNDIKIAVNKAREYFDIKSFPGNFFNLIKNRDYINEYNLILFKEDIGKLSGFIGYGENDLTIICINYKRPIGHQNFTIAHELGHWFLHKGQAISDDEHGYYSNTIEKQASEFAAELLYPEKLYNEDYNFIMQNRLIAPNNLKELAVYIDKICHKYCLSFEFVLRKILFSYKIVSQYKTIRKEIEKALGAKISDYFERDFYLPNDELEEYQQLRYPYEELEKRINTLVINDKIGRATAESIKLRNGISIE